MGYDPVRGPNTYGSGCMPGAERLFAYMRETYQAGSLGCYNPASLGGRSLHAEGRAMDIALNANDPAERARGDAIVAAVVANPDAYGAQEMLWRGGVWSYRRRGEGWRTDPPTQQADHMNHVHLGIDVNAAMNWQPSWLDGIVADTPDTEPGDDTMYLINIVGDDGEYVAAGGAKLPAGKFGGGVILADGVGSGTESAKGVTLRGMRWFATGDAAIKFAASTPTPLKSMTLNRKSFFDWFGFRVEEIDHRAAF